MVEAGPRMSGVRTETLAIARAQVAGAISSLGDAVETLRTGGFPETAADLARLRGGLAVWTNPDGWFDALGKPPIDMTQVRGVDP
jgi:hypothetical protein